MALGYSGKVVKMASLPPLRLRKQAVLDTSDFWMQHDVDIVQAERHSGTPFFYPIYKCGDAYSYSPFALLRHKGQFTPNPEALADILDPRNDVSLPDLCIDTEITRIGGPPQLGTGRRDIPDYIDAMARAMQADITAVEARNPGYTNYILVGGRDSLNLLLADWQNPVVVLSAAPNFDLVQTFVAQNGLGFEVRELTDTPPENGLDREIAEACLMVDLTNWKWAPDLVQLAQDVDHKAIFWKGQFADAVLTDYWRSYTYRRPGYVKFAKKVWRRAARVLPNLISYWPDQLFLEDYRQSIWHRGAVGQGAHLGFLRALTGCLCVSAYHGPQTAQVWLDADLRLLAQQDLRPQIGEALLGRTVNYPASNPSPPASEFRAGLRSLATFETASHRFGLDTPAQQ